MTDDEALTLFPWTYGELVAHCGGRYVNFKKNNIFNDAMRRVKADPDCTHERRLNLSKEGGARQQYFNPVTALAKLDREYVRMPDTQEAEAPPSP